MDRDTVATLARALAFDSDMNDRPISFAATSLLIVLAGGDRIFVREAMAKGFADVRALRGSTDPLRWAV